MDGALACTGGEDDEALQRQQLLSLGRRELQRQAMQLGIKANRKSTDIVQGILSASRGNTPRKRLAHADVAGGTDSEVEEEDSDDDAGAPGGGGTAVSQPGPGSSAGQSKGEAQGRAVGSNGVLSSTGAFTNLPVELQPLAKLGTAKPESVVSPAVRRRASPAVRLRPPASLAGAENLGPAACLPAPGASPPAMRTPPHVAAAAARLTAVGVPGAQQQQPSTPLEALLLATPGASSIPCSPYFRGPAPATSAKAAYMEAMTRSTHKAVDIQALAARASNLALAASLNNIGLDVHIRASAVKAAPPASALRGRLGAAPPPLFALAEACDGGATTPPSPPVGLATRLFQDAADSDPPGDQAARTGSAYTAPAAAELSATADLLSNGLRAMSLSKAAAAAAVAAQGEVPVPQPIGRKAAGAGEAAATDTEQDDDLGTPVFRLHGPQAARMDVASPQVFPGMAASGAEGPSAWPRQGGSVPSLAADHCTPARKPAQPSSSGHAAPGAGGQQPHSADGCGATPAPRQEARAQQQKRGEADGCTGSPEGLAALRQLRRISREALQETQPAAGTELLRDAQHHQVDSATGSEPGPGPAAAPSSQPWGLHITGRTPVRSLRGAAPAAAAGYFGAAAVTPARGAAAGVSTPGAGGGKSVAGGLMRTPARRVAVSADPRDEQRMDAVVAAEMCRPPGGMPWDQVVGLQYIKQQLLGLCPCKAAAGGSAAPARESHTLQQQQQPRLMRAPTRNAPAGAGTPTRSTRPQVGASSTPTGTGRAGQGGARAPQAAALPAAAAASPPSGAGSRAVLLYGPAGMGKALVVRSLVAQQQEGASLIVVPSGLATCPRNGMHADRLVRAVFRVAASRPGCVVLLEDADLLVGHAALQQHEVCRRIRTELLVGLDQLAASSGSIRAGVTSSSSCGTGSSGTGSSSTGSVMVVATTSCPAGLDDPLAAALGRSVRLYAALPDADAREALLLAQAACCDAELGVNDVARIVRATEGYSCADLVALCAAASNAVLQRGGADGRLNSSDFDAALARVHKRSSHEEALQFLKWKSHLSALP